MERTQQAVGTIQGSCDVLNWVANPFRTRLYFDEFMCAFPDFKIILVIGDVYEASITILLLWEGALCQALEICLAM